MVLRIELEALGWGASNQPSYTPIVNAPKVIREELQAVGASVGPRTTYAIDSALRDHAAKIALYRWFLARCGKAQGRPMLVPSAVSGCFLTMESDLIPEASRLFSLRGSMSPE